MRASVHRDGHKNIVLHIFSSYYNWLKNSQNEIKDHSEKKIWTIFNNACHKMLTYPPGELQAGSYMSHIMTLRNYKLTFDLPPWASGANRSIRDVLKAKSRCGVPPPPPPVAPPPPPVAPPIPSSLGDGERADLWTKFTNESLSLSGAECCRCC